MAYSMKEERKKVKRDLAIAKMLEEQKEREEKELKKLKENQRIVRIRNNMKLEETLMKIYWLKPR